MFIYFRFWARAMLTSFPNYFFARAEWVNKLFLEQRKKQLFCYNLRKDDLEPIKRGIDGFIFEKKLIPIPGRKSNQDKLRLNMVCIYIINTLVMCYFSHVSSLNYWLFKRFEHCSQFTTCKHTCEWSWAQ